MNAPTNANSPKMPVPALRRQLESDIRYHLIRNPDGITPTVLLAQLKARHNDLTMTVLLLVLYAMEADCQLAFAERDRLEVIRPASARNPNPRPGRPLPADQLAWCSDAPISIPEPPRMPRGLQQRLVAPEQPYRTRAERALDRVLGATAAVLVIGALAILYGLAG